MCNLHIDALMLALQHRLYPYVADMTRQVLEHVQVFAGSYSTEPNNYAAHVCMCFWGVCLDHACSIQTDEHLPIQREYCETPCVFTFLYIRLV